MINSFTSYLGLEILLCKLNQQPSHLMKTSMPNQQSSQGVRTSFLFCFLSVYILGCKKFLFSEKHVFYFMPCQHQAWSVRAIKKFMLSQHLFQKITNIFQKNIRNFFRVKYFVICAQDYKVPSQKIMLKFLGKYHNFFRFDTGNFHPKI